MFSLLYIFHVVAFLHFFSIGTLVRGDIYFKEEFNDNSWEERWIQSKHKNDYGLFKLSHGKLYGDAKINLGIQTSQDAKFYSLSSKFPKFSNKDKTLVVQFTVKHEQGIDCGGGYIKLMPSTADLEDFHGDTEYKIMFGPDICGPGSKKVHFIINYKNKNHLIKKEIRCKDDELSHLYTMILNPDNTYEVRIDDVKVESGDLESDWDMLEPKKIKDPNAKKPSDWDDRENIDDPDDKKPEDWDKPEHIKDSDAKKPEDWDDEMDGEWEPPLIDNPEYKGEWKPKQIKNPEYKGKWIHPEIDNPEYIPDKELYMFEDLGAIGFDLWQVKSGTIFDNIIITDSLESAKEFAEATFHKTKDAEKKLKEKADEEERKKLEKEMEEAKNKEDKSESDDSDNADDADDDGTKSSQKDDDKLVNTIDESDDIAKERDEL